MVGIKPIGGIVAKHGSLLPSLERFATKRWFSECLLSPVGRGEGSEAQRSRTDKVEKRSQTQLTRQMHKYGGGWRGYVRYVAIG